MYTLIAPFEIIPTPVRERNIIAGLLNNIGPPQEGRYLSLSLRIDLLHSFFSLVAEVVHLCHIVERSARPLETHERSGAAFQNRRPTSRQNVAEIIRQDKRKYHF